MAPYFSLPNLGVAIAIDPFTTVGTAHSVTINPSGQIIIFHQPASSKCDLLITQIELTYITPEKVTDTPKRVTSGRTWEPTFSLKIFGGTRNFPSKIYQASGGATSLRSKVDIFAVTLGFFPRTCDEDLKTDHPTTPKTKEWQTSKTTMNEDM